MCTYLHIIIMCTMCLLIHTMLSSINSLRLMYILTLYGLMYVLAVKPLKCIDTTWVELCVWYCKRGKICWAKLLRFSRFSGVPRKFLHEYRCLSLIILNNEYLRTAYGQGNAKIFPWKVQWHWNCEYLAQRIFPCLRYVWYIATLVELFEIWL